jgi:hypothetical protein
MHSAYLCNEKLLFYSKNAVTIQRYFKLILSFHSSKSLARLFLNAFFCADFRTIGSRPSSTQTAARSLAKSTIGTVPNMKKTHEKYAKMDPFARFVG